MSPPPKEITEESEGELLKKNTEALLVTEDIEKTPEKKIKLIDEKDKDSVENVVEDVLKGGKKVFSDEDDQVVILPNIEKMGSS